MTALLLAVGVVLVSLPAGLSRWTVGLPPASWARWCMTSLVVGALSIEAGLVVVALPTILRAVGAHGLAAVCARMAGVSFSASPAVGWTAAVGATALPVLFTVAMLRGRSTQQRIARAADAWPTEPIAGVAVRILPTDEPLAVSAAHRRGGGVVAVSRGLAHHLSGDQLEAVVRHELAHVRHRHGTILLACAGWDVALAVHPLARRSTAVLRCALERWADEEAAGTASTRRRATKDALVATVLAPMKPPVTAFGPAETVLARVYGLEQPPPAPQRLRLLAVTVPTFALSVVGLTTLGLFTTHLWSALTMPITCPVGLS